jgi:hypothetical protein
LFDRYVFLSPILPGAPTLRSSAGGWTNISLPGIVTIASLDRLGIHWFDAFPVISYAVSPEMSRETYLRNVCRPAIVLLEDADEQVVAGEFAPLMQRLGVDIPVTLVPNMKHADVIATPEALQAVVGAIIAPK